MFPCVSFCRAVWWGIQLRWFRLHGFEYSCAEMGETNPKLCSEQRRIRSFAGILQACVPTNQHSWASIKTFRQDTKEILEQTSCDSHLLYHAECSISCCWPFQLMPSIFCFEDDQDQVRHRTEYCSRVSLNPSMAYCLWWQGPLVHLRPCLDSAYVRGLCKGQLLAVPPPKLVAAARPNVRVSKLHLCRWISSCVFSFDRGGKEQRCS